MQAVSQSVTDALQAVLMIERAAMSQFHDQEHMEEYKENGKLEKWFDGLGDDSRDRRRRLLRRLFSVDAIPNPAMETPEPAAQSEMVALSQTMNILERLATAYRAVHAAATVASDAVAESLATKAIKGVEMSICETNARQEKYRKMGGAVWLGSVAQ